MKQGVKYEHSYSPVPHASGLLPLLKTCLSIMLTSTKPSFKMTCSKRKGLKVTSTSHLLQAMVRMQNMSIAFAHRYTVPAPTVRHGIELCQL